MARPVKRQKAAAAGKKGDSGIVGAWAKMKEDGPLLFESMEKYLDWVKASDEDTTGMLAALYRKDVVAENKFVVPVEFQDFTCSRNDKMEIIGIKDKKNKGIVGSELDKVLVYAALKDKGAGIIILEKGPDGNLEALVIPNGIQVADVNEKAKKAFHTDIRMLYTYKTSMTIYASNENITTLLELNYVTLSEVCGLVRALNALSSKEDIQLLEKTSLEDVDSLQAAVIESKAKATRLSFFQTLFGAMLRSLDQDKRLELFTKSPSFTLANQLDLRMPHGGPCFSKFGNRPMAKVALGSLKPGDRILMSTNTMSLKDYKNITGALDDLQVYLDSENLGARKGNKFVEMNVKHTEEFEYVTGYLTAIATSNDSKGKSPKTKDSELMDTDGIDLVTLD